MAEYRYYLIPDFMSHVFPQQFEEQAPTEFFSNTADLMKRYKQLREMPYNNEYTWNERTNLPYPRLTVGIDRRDPDGAVTIMHVRNGVNYLCDDYRGPFADRNDKQLIEMAKQLVTAVGVDRIRPHYYTEENGHTKVHVGKDIHITEWANASELCSALRFSRFLNRDGQQLFQVRNGQRIIENYADGSQLVKDVQTVDDTHFYVGSRFCHIQQYANQCFKRGCYVEPEHPQPGDKLDRLLIYQIPHYTCEYRFTDYDYAQNKLKATDYRCAYVANMPRDYTPDKCFRDFNYDDRPCANSMPSLSVSDLIVMERDDKAEALYVDAVGFKDVSRLLPELHDMEEAVQEIEKKLAYMHKEEYDAIAKARERNMPASIAVSYDLKSKMHHTEQMMDDITTKNQKIFKVCILIHTYGDSNAQLDERVRRICSTVQQQTCRFDSILYEQRIAMNSMLPLGKKWLGLERTLETVSTAIYVPFTTQELFQPGGLYEGINARSKNLILCNRKLLPAPAGMVLGMTGYGKSFSVMQMVTNIMLRWPDDDIVLIDPEQEYTHLVTAMGGVVIDISASSPSHINPMDITEDYGDDEDPIRLKSQFLQNFCQLILHSSELSPQERTFIDVAAGLTYQRYMANPKREEMPTLHDFYRNLALQGEEVKPLLTALKLYVSGSMDLFAHQTNVNVQNHCICFNTVKLGKSMQSIGMLTVLDQVWNRITRNRVLGRRTWVFTDEFQQLLGNKDCTDFYFQLSSRARKWGAILTSITQHVRSVLDNEDARRMLSDCGYIKLLNQSPDDANDLARLLHISNEEKRYIENAEVGSGLLIVSKTVVPFNNDFPKDTELFRLMDTSPNRKS